MTICPQPIIVFQVILETTEITALAATASGRMADTEQTTELTNSEQTTTGQEHTAQEVTVQVPVRVWEVLMVNKLV